MEKHPAVLPMLVMCAASSAAVGASATAPPTAHTSMGLLVGEDLAVPGVSFWNHQAAQAVFQQRSQLCSALGRPIHARHYGGRDWDEGLRLPVKHDDHSGAKAVENRTITPSVEVFRHGMTAVCKCIRIPSIVLANQSVLVAFAECRHSWGDGCYPGNSTLQPAPAEQTSSLASKRPRHVRSILGDIVMRRSLDPLGKRWSKISTLTESAGQPTAVCAAHSGQRRGGCRLILFFVTSAGINMMMTSDDAGASFTGPNEVTANGARFPHTLMTGPGTAIQLHSGRIVSSGWTIVPRSPANPGGSGWHGVFFSDDNAETFSLSRTKIVGDGTGIDESTIAELSTGDLALFSRNYHNCSQFPVPQFSDGACVARTDSTDGGETWGKTSYLPSLPTPHTELSVLTDRNDKGTTLYLSHPATLFPRENCSGHWGHPCYRMGDPDWPETDIDGSILRSTDDGMTWSRGFQILGQPVGNSFGYSCLTKMPDDHTIGLLFETSTSDGHCKGPTAETPWWTAGGGTCAINFAVISKADFDQ